MTVKQSVSTAVQEAQSTRNYTENTMSAAKGGSIVASGRLFAYATRVLVVYLMARALGADHYGLYSIALSTATVIAGAAAFGLHTTLVRYVAVYRNRKDEAELWGLLQLGIGLSLLLSTLMAIGLFTLSHVVAEQIYDRSELVPLLQIMAIVIPFMTMSTVVAGATRGFKKMHYGVIAQNVVQVLVRLVLIAIMFVIGMKAIHAVVIFGVANIIVAALLLYFLHREFPLNRSLRFAKHNRRELLSFSVPVWISGLLRTFRANIQTLLLGTFYTAAGVGIFAVVSRTNLLGRMTLNSISTSARPIIAEIHADDDRAQLANIYHTTGRWAVTINIPIFLVLMFFSEAILAIYGDEFIGGAIALRILAVAELIDAMTGICGAIIDMTGYTKLKLANSITQLVLSIGVSILLIPRYGLIGAAVGALIVNAVINNLRMIEVWYLFRILPFDRTFIKPALAALVAVITALITLQVTEGSLDLIMLMLQVAILFIVYAGMLLLLGLPEEERTILSRLRRRISQRRLKTT